MKAQWKKPTLVVLSRGNPEEMVLTFCKSVHGSQAGPQNFQNKCDQQGPGQRCGACQAEPPKNGS